MKTNKGNKGSEATPVELTDTIRQVLKEAWRLSELGRAGAEMSDMDKVKFKVLAFAAAQYYSEQEIFWQQELKRIFSNREE